jgi:hypothetical protein
MKKTHIILPLTLLSELAMIAAACSPQPAAVATASLPPASQSTSTPPTFSDPFAYCAAVGTADTPDVRYTGEAVPDAVINGFKKAAGLEGSTETTDMFKKSTIWRCMAGKVYACNFGANLPCDSKANTDKTPSQPIDDFCKANPNSQVIPMSVTGHDTIYNWTCVNDKAQITEQIGQVDAEGYLAQIWYAIEPSP